MTSSTTAARSTGSSGRSHGARVGAGEEEQILDQSGQSIDLLLTTLEYLPCLHRPGGGTERDLDLAFQNRERGAQLMRRVGAEVANGGERALEACQHVVQHGGEATELVVPVLGRETAREVLGSDAACGRDHGVDGRQSARR